MQECPADQPKFELQQVDTNCLAKCLREMCNKKDVDFLSPGILLDAWPIIGDMICDIVNLSLTSSMPDIWKMATVVPVAKIPQPKLDVDYRPVNMLPTLEKLIETMVKDQLLAYIERYGILSRFQSAYRERHSCETALNLLLMKWKEIHASGDMILAVFLDLKRAFETIDRRLLLDKLRKLGWSTNAIEWFNGYLTNRSQRTKIGELVSNCKRNDLGVPQGSVLGAILFIIYINDLPAQLMNAFVNLFADDTLVYVHGKDIDTLTDRMNVELDRISKWLRVNKLKLNVNKTKAMVIPKASYVTAINMVTVDQQEIEIVNEIKYLGVMIDSQLAFKANVDHVCKKVAKKVGVLSRLARQITMGARISIYKSIIAPHFDYCSSLLFLCNQTAFDRLQKLQNRAMRAVLMCKRLTPIAFMLDWNG